MKLVITPIRHTHEDVDQRHSVFWRWFNKQEAIWSWPHLLERWSAGNHAAALRILPGLWNFKTWLAPHLNRVQGITKPHLFHLYAGMCKAQENDRILSERMRQKKYIAIEETEESES